MRICTILLSLAYLFSASAGQTDNPTDPPTHAPLVCNKMNNTLGNCACDEQLWINEDCTEGFYCSSSVADAEGCGLKCTNPGEIILVDPRTDYWECISLDQSVVPICPGAFHIDCPCPSDEACGFGDCQCDGQLWISQDCNKAKHCDSSFDAGSKEYTCPAGQIVEILDVDNPSSNWRCIKDDGRCPGAFHVGCQTDAPTSPPTHAPLVCNKMNNTLGTCGCDEQLWINEDCTEGFYCSSSVADADGCGLKCTNPGEIILVDPRTDYWECISLDQSVVPICPGAFHIDCPCPSDEDCGFGDCQCDGQLWISTDCNKAKHCNSSFETGSKEYTCPAGQIVEILNVDNPSSNWRCIKDDGRCPGAFHVGCQTDAPTDPPTTTKKTPECNPSQNNTIGVCECEQQLWVSNDCREGFYCVYSHDGLHENDGCGVTCAEDEFLIVDTRPDVMSWECIPRMTENNVSLVCPGTFHVDCPCQTAEECQFGQCECDGQLWVSQDCMKARYCNSRYVGGMRELTCPLGMIVDIDTIHNQWSCIPDDGRCPGAFHVGCQDQTTTARPPVICEPGNNTLGTCACDQQLWIGNHCREGFFCMNDTQDDGNEGCHITCAESEVLIVDPRHDRWDCVDMSYNDALHYICPGNFHIDCPCETDEECGFGECACEGQLWISEDCKRGKYCGRNFPNGHMDINCPPDFVIQVDPIYHTWKCIPDDNRCPGAFHVGCQTDAPTPTPEPTHAPLVCNKMNNTLGTCGCDEQLWINEDCTEGFYCSSSVADAEGCGLKCTNEGEIILVDPRTDYWECISLDQSAVPICPGAFHIDCPCPSDDACGFGDCQCDGQLWISEDCNKAKHCDSSFETGSKEYTCPAGQIVEILDIDNPSSNWRCIKDDGRCPGAFHVGCQTDGPPTTTVPPTTTGKAAGKSMFSIATICITALLSFLL